MEIAKALILAGRPAYDRPWPSVGPGPKHLVPVANRPILFHSLAALRRANLLEAAIVVEPESVNVTQRAIGNGSRWGLSVRCIPWDSDTGLPGALAVARDFVADEPVLVQPADALHREQIYPRIATFAHEGLDAMALRLRGARDATGKLITGAYLLSQRAISHLLTNGSAEGEPLAGLTADGGRVQVEEFDGCLACHGGQDQLLEANRRMLEDLVPTEPREYPGCEFQGPVAIDPTAELEHTLVRGPAVIGAGSRLRHAYVGPYTAIGANVILDGCQLEHSIVLDDARLSHVGSRIETSVIGRGARVERAFVLPSAIRLSVGDGAEVTLP